MWSSIKQIIKPDSLNEALILPKETGAALFTGGTYLVSQKDTSRHTLVDSNHLLENDINQQLDKLQVGAACTLQDLLNFADPGLVSAISAACPSKNIRNQRSLGGEIAQARTDSDLLIYLHAAEAYLQINESEELVHIAEWEGDGIISMVHIPLNNTRLERVSVLDSAPAFVIVAVHQTKEHITLAIGGKSTRIIYCKSSISPEEEQIRTFMDKVESIFTLDHFGSPAYKRQLVSNLLAEMTVTA